MPNNTINYAQRWQPELLEVMTQNALCGPFVTTNVRWLDARTFHFTQMSVSGYKAHSRDGGWNRGKVTQTDKSYTVSHDRDVEFLIDKADVDESNATAAVKNISALSWINENSPPTVCAYGAHDKVQAFPASKRLAAALEEHGVSHEYIVFPHSGHGLQNDNKLYARYMDKVCEYLDTYMGV